MDSPNAINIYTDGAMNYDSRQTGGTGFAIYFPELSGIPPIRESFRRDDQGIHRLEMIAIHEAMEALIAWIKLNGIASLNFSRVTIHTDRFSLTDSEGLKPWNISAWRKNNWKNYEGLPIKNKDLVDDIDKARQKLHRSTGGRRIEIVYIRRKHNKEADNLSKKGKESEVRSRKIIQEKRPAIAKRLFDGENINCKELNAGDRLEVRIYRKELVQSEYEISAEVANGKYFGKTIKIYVDAEQEYDLHRHHYYDVVIKTAYRYHVIIENDFKEVVKE